MALDGQSPEVYMGELGKVIAELHADLAAAKQRIVQMQAEIEQLTRENNELKSNAEKVR